MKLTTFPLLFLLIFSFSTLIHAQSDPYLHQRYDALHDSPMQQKFRKLAPMPAGVVYVQQPNEGEKEMRVHFQNMKKLSFETNHALTYLDH